MSSFLSGPGYLLSGFSLMTRPRLRLFVVGPLLINIILYCLGTYLLYTEFESWMASLTGYLPDWLDWITYILWPLLGLSLLLIVYFSFTPLALLIASPFNGFLSEQTERYLQNTLPDGENFSFAGLLKDLWLNIKNELVKLRYFLVRAIPLLLLYFVPAINIAAPFIWFLFSAWMLGLTYVDYPFSNRNIWFAQQRPDIAQKRQLVLGFGCAVAICTMIPIINFFVIPAAVCGATKLWLDELRRQ